MEDPYQWHVIRQTNYDRQHYGYIGPVSEAFWNDEPDAVLDTLLKQMAPRILADRYPALQHGTLHLLRWRVQPPPFIRFEDEPEDMVMIEALFEHEPA